MVWSTQQQLLTASGVAAGAPGSLYAKGKAAKIDDNDNAEHYEYLTNQQFLDKMVEAKELTEEDAKSILDAVSAGYPFSADDELNQKLWKSVQGALFYSSLPETYAYSDIAKRLAASGQLSNKASAGARIDKTGAMTLAMVNGMADGDGTGLHRAYCLGGRHVRLGNLAKEQDTNRPLVNQASMSFTLLTFASTPFAAVLRVGKGVPDEDHRLAWLQMWCVIGSLMGIEDEGIPWTLEAAESLDQLFRQSPQWVRTVEAQKLITVLVELGGNQTAVFYAWAGEPLMKLLGVQLPE
jgi:hypothetical protein